MLPPDPRTPMTGKEAGPAIDHLPHAGSPAGDTGHAPAEPPAALSAAPSLGTLLHAFRRVWLRALSLGLLGAIAAAAAAWYFVPPQYASSIVLRINSRPNHGSLEDESNFANVQKSQVAFLKSYEVLSEAVTRARLSERYGVTYTPAQLRKRLLTQFNEGPEILEVQFAAENPEVAAGLLNSIGEVYAAKVNSADEARVKSRITQLRARLRIDTERRDLAGKGLARDAAAPLPSPTPTLAEQLRDKRIELTAAEKEAGLDDPNTIAAKYNNGMLMLQTAQQSVREKKLTRTGLEAEILAKKERLARPASSGSAAVVTDADVEAILRGDNDYQQLMKEIGQKRKQIDDIRRVAKRGTLERLVSGPMGELKALESDRQTILEASREQAAVKARATSRDLLQKDVVDLEDKLEHAKKQETALEVEVRRWSDEVQRLRAGGPKPPPEVEALRDQVKQLEREYQQIGDELAKLEGSLPLHPRVTTHAEAFVPVDREYSRPLKYAVAGAVLAFGFLAAAICFLEAQGRRIYAPDDVRQGLGLPVVGTVPQIPPRLRKQAGRLVSSGGTETPFGLIESIDGIRTVLMHAPRVDGARVVMVTSAASGEGKTTLASQLAGSLARAWRKTLLIDADLRHPAQHTQFDQPLEPGLCEALRGEVEFEDVIRPTPVSRLWMLPAGKLDAHALQALAQEGLSLVFERLKDQYDFIVLDSSPVLPVPDALLLGKQADAVLLAVMKDVSRMPAVYQAQQRLERLDIPVMGAVVLGEQAETYGAPAGYPAAKK